MSSLFQVTDVPANSGNTLTGINVGMAFFVSSAASCVGLRFYKNANDTSTSHTLTLWDVATHASLGTATTSSETSSGWQEATLSTPIPLTANKAYRVSVFTMQPNTYYSYNLNYFTAAKTNGIITAYQDGTVPHSGANEPNCTYDTNSSADYPSLDTTAQANYWVDVNVSAAAALHFPIAISDVSTVSALGFHGATGTGGGAITKVQGPLNAVGNASVHTISKAFTVNVTAGNFLIAFANCAAGSGTSGVVTDSLGQTWTPVFTWQTNVVLGAGIFYKENTLGGACTVTLTCGTGDNYPDLTIFEYSGILSASSGDGTNHTTSSTASLAPSSGNLTTANAADLLFAGCVSSALAGLTGGTSGWTYTTTGNGNGVEYNIVSATGTYAATFANSSSDVYIAAIAAFKGSAQPLHFALAIADVSTVSALGFHIVAPIHFAMPISDVSSVLALGFHGATGAPLGHNYSTLFPLTENPISESSKWLNGALDGLDWTNVRTSGGFAFGTQPGNASGPSQYADSTAILKGTWGPNQTVQAKARIPTPTSAVNVFEEISLRLRSNLSAHSCTGYEVLFSASLEPTSGNYVQIVRWNGALAGFTLLDGRSFHAVDGDTLKATIVGNTITAYLNNTTLFSVTDSTYATGNPGFGFYLQNATGVNANYGISSFSASDGTAVSFPMAISSTSTVSLGFHKGTGSLTLVFPMAIADASQVISLGFHGVLTRNWASNGADVGGSGAYVPGTQSVQYLHDNFAQVGDTITIPAGTFTWATGVGLTKAVTLLGSASAGATNIVWNNNTGIMLGITPGATALAEFGWATLTCSSAVTSKNGHFIYIGYVPGAKPFRIHDLSVKSVSALNSQILCSQNGGLIYNSSFDGGNIASGSGSGITSIDECIQLKNPGTDLWKSLSTMGMAGDPTGTLNTYIEDCTFSNAPTEAIDCDDGSRVVLRHCTFVDAVIASHGYDTSPWGNRHWEFYDNIFKYPHSYGDTNAANVQNQITMRGGTGVITGNIFQPVASQNWGPKNQVTWLSDGVTQGSAGKCYSVYPAARQVGQGWNGGAGGYSQAPELGTGYFTDPTYVWSNSMDNTYQTGSFSQSWVDNTGCSGGHTSAEFIQANRDFFLNVAKPGWSRFTYPHPYRAGTPPPSFPIHASDTSTVLALGFHATIRFSLAIQATSTVQALGFHAGGTPFPLHFQMSIVESSSVVLGFRQRAPVRFPMAITDTSAVSIGFHQARFAFPVNVTSTSSVHLGFSNDHYSPASRVVPPYSGQTQVEHIAVNADIAWRESQMEEGCWSIPPYAQIYPPDGETEGTDIVPPPLSKTDLWAAMQEWPL